jgi:P27 family predicted phage terminase small subunit
MPKAVPVRNGRPSRTRKPDNIKLLEGVFRKDLGSAKELMLSESAEPPQWVIERNKRYFEHIKDLIAPFGHDSASFAEVIALAANRMAEMEDYNALIEADGCVVERENGSMVAHPAVKLRSEAARHLHTLLCELGLTPSSAGRLSKEKYEQRKGGSTEEKVGFGGL